VLSFARTHGLEVVSAAAPPTTEGLIALVRERRDSDVINLTSYLKDEPLAVVYSACDAVLANSGHEPFGLVGLEVMAAGGLAVTGSTGEDYAEPMRNALVVETDDPIELVTLLRLVREKPVLAASIRKRGRATAKDYVWESVIENLLLRTEFAAAQQSVRLATTSKVSRPPARRTPARRRVK
jgi:glycosyltransferase involved in cell wall biosynthesis